MRQQVQVGIIPGGSEYEWVDRWLGTPNETGGTAGRSPVPLMQSILSARHSAAFACGRMMRGLASVNGVRALTIVQ
ncbi:MAG: hypothetical protein JOY82_23305 [Streptosporangiaceae bacterium]|nr:hypothetical protein [Streptosporangiaceae bacterium]MBV9857410.1 hypothetical protein [Streptosporangiaceae bacterium]